jgi:heterokaryon incompatibility protein (HET)
MSDVLPTVLPEDAITVTLTVGFRYLWVDKYCLSQDSHKKHHEIQQMGLIYVCSELTIIAAAGESEREGLPGVSKRLKRSQRIVEHEDIQVISTMPHLRHLIRNLSWMTRGWTLQEGLLARRRPVFTKDQI